MTKSNTFAAAQFHDEEAARTWFEAARWPDGPVCPHCGSLKHYATKKAGRYRCGEKECRKDFTVMTGSVMERSHAKLTQWAMAFYLGASSKKGFSAHQLHRALGCQYNTAWFLHHRVMEAMREGGLAPLGGVYHHCSEKHLHRYLAEFDFRYNRRTALGVTDEERTLEAVRGGEGKRLTYHQPHSA